MICTRDVRPIPFSELPPNSHWMHWFESSSIPIFAEKFDAAPEAMSSPPIAASPLPSEADEAEEMPEELETPGQASTEVPHVAQAQFPERKAPRGYGSLVGPRRERLQALHQASGHTEGCCWCTGPPVCCRGTYAAAGWVRCNPSGGLVTGMDCHETQIIAAGDQVQRVLLPPP